MTRWTALSALALMGIADAAFAADQIAIPRDGARTVQVPRTAYRRHAAAENNPDALISSPSTIPTTPLLPGSSTLPGYYGRPFNYYYQGPYYGGEYTSYFVRLPYACGVTGYC